jgi:hypothetical protein
LFIPPSSLFASLHDKRATSSSSRHPLAPGTLRRFHRYESLGFGWVGCFSVAGRTSASFPPYHRGGRSGAGHRRRKGGPVASEGCPRPPRRRRRPGVPVPLRPPSPVPPPCRPLTASSSPPVPYRLPFRLPISEPEQQPVFLLPSLSR